MIALVVVALASVLLVGLLNAVAARQLLDSGAEDRLISIANARARSIEAGAGRLRARVAVAAADPAVVVAMEELTAGHAALADPLERDQLAELEDWYRARVAEPIEAAGLDGLAGADLLPVGSAARQLQYRFIVQRPPGANGRELVDPGDGSAYSTAHVAHHPYLVTVAGGLGGGDLLLVSAAGDVVYTTDKRIDLGTNLRTGPHRDTTLAGVLRDQLSRASAGDTVVSDLELYIPAGGAPTLFLAAAVRQGTAIAGAIAVEVPAATLSAITTANGRWEAVGLPEGESYVVGADLVLRSESRLWIEDPSDYLRRVDDDELAALIDTFGSPVGLQPVDTDGVRQALSGGPFDGQARNYLGQRTFSSVVPIDVEGVDWVVVVDTPLGEARAPLYDYAIRMGIALLVLLPLAGLVGFFLADRLARPIPPLAGAARKVAAGDRSPDPGTLGGDELGDLGRRLLQTASELSRQEEELEAEFERKRRLLLSVLPSRLISERGDVSDWTGDRVETTTAIAIGVTASPAGDDPEVEARVLTLVGDLADELATDRGIERIRSAADRHLFLGGVGSEDPGADDAVAFASELLDGTRRIADDEDVAVEVHIGLSTGSVATGVLDGGSLTYGAWGEPVRRSLAIAALADAEEVLVDRSTAAAIGRAEVDLDPAADVISLDGEPMGLLALRRSPEPAARTGSSPG